MAGGQDAPVAVAASSHIPALWPGIRPARYCCFDIGRPARSVAEGLILEFGWQRAQLGLQHRLRRTSLSPLMFHVFGHRAQDQVLLLHHGIHWHLMSLPCFMSHEGRIHSDSKGSPSLKFPRATLQKGLKGFRLALQTPDRNGPTRNQEAITGGLSGSPVACICCRSH